MSVTNALLCAHRFSADRTITEYANDIWRIKQYPVPNPAGTPLDRKRSKECLEGKAAKKEEQEFPVKF